MIHVRLSGRYPSIKRNDAMSCTAEYSWCRNVKCDRVLDLGYLTRRLEFIGYLTKCWEVGVFWCCRFRSQMACYQRESTRKILEFMNEKNVWSQLNGRENHRTLCYRRTAVREFIIWTLYLKRHVRRATRRFHWSILLENNFGLVSSCFVFRTICLEFDCHFVSSCMNDVGIYF
jgi:hypothetical protein